MIRFLKKIIGLFVDVKTAKFSLGQPVCYDIKKNGKVVHSVPLEVVYIHTDINPIVYHCRHQWSNAISIFTEDQLNEIAGRKAA